jgi:hypothetical protein
VRDHRTDGAEADALRHAEAQRHLHDGLLELPPAVVGLGAGQHQEVTVVCPDGADVELVPSHPGQDAVVDVERGPPCPVIDQSVGIELHDDLAVAGEVRGGGGAGGSGIDPAVQRGDKGR